MRIDPISALRLLKSGEIVALPTETVYGLAAIATSDDAAKKIFEAKGRPSFNPLIIHVHSIAQAMEYAEFSDLAIKIAEKFWPGPLTLVLKRKNSIISNFVTAGLETIAIRMPSHKIMLDILKQLNIPLAAPSANRSERISPTNYDHVIKSLGEHIPVVDGGASIFGLESTIIDVSSDLPKILRLGFITQDVISEFLKIDVALSSSLEAIKAPGMMKRHYSPLCKIRINADNASINEIAINFGSSNLSGFKNYNLSKEGDLDEAASKLYQFLQQAEDDVLQNNLSSIAVAKISKNGIGAAINDKLERATSNTKL